LGIHGFFQQRRARGDRPGGIVEFLPEGRLNLARETRSLRRVPNLEHYQVFIALTRKRAEFLLLTSKRQSRWLLPDYAGTTRPAAPTSRPELSPHADPRSRRAPWRTGEAHANPTPRT
jgi:hypothetical protein